jgi:F-type H+-transporting ATPase subunit epsilon
LIGRLGVGELRVKPVTGGGTLSFFISGGFLQVLADRVVVLATRAEPAAAIDHARAEEEVRRIQAEEPPPHSKIAVLDARRERLRAAQIRLKLASRTRAAG